MSKSEIAARIRQARKNAGMTQQDAARALNVSGQAISNYERGTNKIGSEVLARLCMLYGVKVSDILGMEPDLPKEAIPYNCDCRIPLLGVIPAGVPLLAVENIEGYLTADVSDPENYFFLRVRGDSMTGARIYDGDLVLVHRQSSADNGQIVACRINQDEATLKRFKKQGDTILLLPENPAYEPRILSSKEFEQGEASILGVVCEVRYKP